jgi:hypothetical protein
MTSYEVFSGFLIKYSKLVAYIFFTLFILMCLATLNRKYRLVQKVLKKKKKVWTDETPAYDRAYVAFAFQGENLPDNQWFLEMDISKDFNSQIISRQEYLSLARVTFSHSGNQHGLQVEKET